MAWTKQDDKSWLNERLQDACLEDPAALALYWQMNPRVGHDNTEGVVTKRMLQQLCGLFGLRNELTTILVATGLWHTSKSLHRCERCRWRVGLIAGSGKLATDEFYVHDFLEENLTRNQALWSEEQRKHQRNKELGRNPQLRRQIYERDHGLCRYCGIEPDVNDKVGLNGRTHDHVDPSEMVNRLENIVIACRGCNSRKNDRHLSTAGMELLTSASPGASLREQIMSAPSQPGPSPGQPDAGTELASRAGQVPDRVGPDREPAGSQPGPSPSDSGGGDG